MLISERMVSFSVSSVRKSNQKLLTSLDVIWLHVFERLNTSLFPSVPDTHHQVQNQDHHYQPQMSTKNNQDGQINLQISFGLRGISMEISVEK